MAHAGADERPPPLRLVYSDELGQLKGGEPDKSQWIDCIALGSSNGIVDTATAVLAVARRSGAIELRSPLTGEALGDIPAAGNSSGSAQQQQQQQQQQQDAGRVRGLHLLWSGSDGLPAVLSVTQGGNARLHEPAAMDGASGRGSWEQTRSWQVPAEVCCTAYDPSSNRLAVGCKGAELRLFDVGSGELVFAFKGGRPNKVGLVDKPWNTAVTFLPPAGSGGPGERLLVGTGHHKVRLYDAAAGKRPQLELAWGEARVTCLAPEPCGRRCWVGNGLGQLEVLDLAAGKFCGAVKGLSGALRALAVHPSEPVLASVGLDRFLRLHSTHSRQLLAKVYCKTLPTGLALCPTDASMLPPMEQGRKQKKGAEYAAAQEALDGSDEEEAPRQQKRSKRPREGTKQRKEGRRQQDSD